MKRLIVALVVCAAAVWATVALATPGQGQTNKIISIGTLQGQHGVQHRAHRSEASGTRLGGSGQYTAQQLPEFLMKLRRRGGIGPRHLAEPATGHLSAVRMVPVGLLAQGPEIVTQQATFAPAQRRAGTPTPAS